MSGAAHTPGPWHWDGSTLMPVKPEPDHSAVHSILERDGGYGYLMSDPKATLAELEADYALIAAAPELLAAWRMATMLRQLGGMLPGSREIVQSIVDAADAAIAKATGSAS